MITDTKPNLWFHIHIPKTAGSTLRQILSRNFQNSYFSAVSLLEHRKLGLAETTEIVEKHFRWLRCYSDHRLSLDLPFDADEVNTKALAFVRNPVDQVVSQYCFQRDHRRRKTEVSSMSLAEFVERKFNRPGRLSKGLQLQRLKGESHGRTIDEIKQLLDEKKLYLFPLEEFDVACTCLEQSFPHEFRSNEYLYANKGPSKVAPDEAVVARIRELVAPDFELHNIATWFMSVFANSVFESQKLQQANIQNLQARCRSLKKEVTQP